MTKTRLLILAVALLAVGLTAVPRLSAAPTCTVTWDGGAGTAKGSAPANWSANVLPGATDHVCTPAGSSVTFDPGTATTLSLQAQGPLTITAGTLTLTDTGALNASNANDLALAGGVIAG